MKFKFKTIPERSRIMSKIRGKDTKIEVNLRLALWHMGIRYRKNNRKLPGNPDIALTKYRIAIFCDSDFFHGYNWEQKKVKLKHNREYWIKKIENNMARDKKHDNCLAELGWLPLHFWEHDINKSLDSCITTILSYLPPAYRQKK